MVAYGGKRFAHEFLVRKWTIGLSRIEEGDATVNSRPNEGDHFLPVPGQTVVGAHAHAAKPDSRHFQVAISKFALLHCSSYHC
jgi:hypothetical protein